MNRFRIESTSICVAFGLSLFPAFTLGEATSILEEFQVSDYPELTVADPPTSHSLFNDQATLQSRLADGMYTVTGPPETGINFVTSANTPDMFSIVRPQIKNFDPQNIEYISFDDSLKCLGIKPPLVIPSNQSNPKLDYSSASTFPLYAIAQNPHFYFTANEYIKSPTDEHRNSLVEQLKWSQNALHEWNVGKPSEQVPLIGLNYHISILEILIAQHPIPEALPIILEISNEQELLGTINWVLFAFVIDKYFSFYQAIDNESLSARQRELLEEYSNWRNENPWIFEFVTFDNHTVPRLYFNDDLNTWLIGSRTFCKVWTTTHETHASSTFYKNEFTQYQSVPMPSLHTKIDQGNEKLKITGQQVRDFAKRFNDARHKVTISKAKF